MTVSIGVIGAGISGLATAWNLRERLRAIGLPHEITVYESADRAGGSIRSSRDGGFLVEWGPNGFLNNEPATLELVDKLGLTERLAVSRDTARRRFILIGGRLREVPASPQGFIATDMIPLGAKLRFALEPFVRRARNGADESVAQFVRRRFGAVALERMFDPLLSGIYAGDVNALSIHSTLKVFSELEREHGSVVRGMLARMIRRRRELKKNPEKGLLTTSKNPMLSKLISFRDGMGELTATLAQRLGDDLHTATRAVALTRRELGFELVTMNGAGPAVHAHDQIVLALPPAGASRLLETVDSNLAATLLEIPSAPIAVIALGYRAADLANTLGGFGYLIPRTEKLRSLGVLWSSSIFAERAEDGHVLLTAMIGGAHDAAALDLDDAELVAIAVREFTGVLGPKAEPVFARVVRHQTGIPQYVLGHTARLAAIESRLKNIPDLSLAGNGYHGISANDCIRRAAELAERIAGNLPGY